MSTSKPILLVEDDRLDAMIVKRALTDLKITNQLVHKADGQEALEYLKNDANKKPCLILLDFNTSKTNGVDFLRTIKADETLTNIPVVALTASTKEQNVIETFKLGIAGYIIKPANYIKFIEAIRKLPLPWTLGE